MNYNLKCRVRHGICWNGGVREYDGDVQVEFTPQEVQLIKTTIVPTNDEDVCEQLEEKLPEIYEKIRIAATDFLEYSLMLNVRITGVWLEGNEDESIDEKKLMQEDIDSGRFKPLYKNEGDPDELIECEWNAWEAHHLEHLPYKERTEFYSKRYNVTTEGFDEYDYDFDFTLPAEIFH